MTEKFNEKIVYIMRKILYLHLVEIKYIFSDVCTDSKKAD